MQYYPQNSPQKRPFKIYAPHKSGTSPVFLKDSAMSHHTRHEFTDQATLLARTHAARSAHVSALISTAVDGLVRLMGRRHAGTQPTAKLPR